MTLLWHTLNNALYSSKFQSLKTVKKLTKFHILITILPYTRCRSISRSSPCRRFYRRKVFGCQQLRRFDLLSGYFFKNFFAKVNNCAIFAPVIQMVVVAQLVRASVCGAEGRRFEPGHPPKRQKPRSNSGLFLCL